MLEVRNRGRNRQSRFLKKEVGTPPQKGMKAGKRGCSWALAEQTVGLLIKMRSEARISIDRLFERIPE